MEFIITTLIALVVGSFLNVVIYRLPIMMQRPPTLPFNLALPASQCRHCHTSLRFWHNIPLLSFLFLKGRCHACQQTISWRYPLVEILSVLLSLIALVQIGWQPLLGAVLLFTYVLIALTFIDIDEQLLPDSMTLPLLGMGLALNSFDIFTSASQAIWGALLGFILLWLIDALYYMIRKRHGIGMGDCKLLAALGAWLGASALAPILLIASVLGLGVAILFIALKRLKYDTPIAFGPFLAIAAWGYLIC